MVRWGSGPDSRGVRAPVRRPGLSRAAVVSAALSALLLLGLTSSVAVGATVMAPKCDYVRARTGPGTTYAIKATLMRTSRVTVVATVTGGHYGTSCGGAWISGSTWDRISAINGKSVLSLYGRTYVYGATGLFRAVVTSAPTASPTGSASPLASPGSSVGPLPASPLPSVNPSPLPSVNPSPLPSVNPSPLPSVNPSPLPSSIPSIAPSVTPSLAPSLAPSSPPSAVPSLAPSPSPLPTPLPTPVPTPVPTSGPWEKGPTTLPDTITFYGRGYGHGVGLSQYGAYGRAVAGQTASTIVAHYYPGTTLGTMVSTNVRVLVLQSFVATSSDPLRIYGRIGAWTIDGIAATFPADAQLRMYADTTAASGWHLTVIGPDAATLWNGAAPSNAFYVRPASSLSLLQLYSKPTSYDRFRGTLRVLGQTGGTVNVVNWVTMETYLQGVVPVEMSSSWPTEALRSQAIAARSYAAYRLHPATGSFDVYDDTRSQVYYGQLGEKTNGTAAVTATAGQVVLYKGAVADALFHSGDGGWTENNEYVFVSSSGAVTAGVVPYLRGSSDRAPDGTSYDKTSPFATWRTTFYTKAQIQAIFAADSRTNVGTLVALDLSRRGVSGRLISVTLIGADGTKKTVSGGVFISVFNAKTPSTDPAMRNTLFDLVPIP
jgi:stage II sporulation protein D